MIADFPIGRLAFQPDAKNVQRRIGVAIVRRPAVRTFPASHSKRTHTFGAAVGNGPASRARLGSPSFVSLNIHRLPSGSLVSQHVPERRPASVHDGFRHLGFRKPSGVHIANNDQFILPSDPRGMLMKVVTARICDLRMDRAHPLLVPRSLSGRQRRFVLPIMTESRNLRAVAKRRNIFEAKVNADDAATSGQVVHYVTLQDDVPTAAGILDKGAIFKDTGNRSRSPEPELALLKNNEVVTEADGLVYEGYPAECALAAEACSELGTSAKLIARFGELTPYLVYAVRVEPKKLPGAFCHIPEVNSARPKCVCAAFSSTLHFALRGNAVIPNLIAGSRFLGKPIARRSVLDPVFVRDECHPKIIENLPKNASVTTMGTGG